jgi:hypothetical protein
MMAGGVELDHHAIIIVAVHHATGAAIRATVPATAGKVAADGVPGGGADGAQLPRMDLALLLLRG